MTRKTWAAGMAVVTAFGAGVLLANFVSAQGPIGVKQVLRDDLKGLDGQETIMAVVEVEPGASLPWHVHPDGHEIAYVLEGTAIKEIDGQGRTTVKAGEGFYIPPGVVHRGSNEGPGKVKVLVVRVTAKGKPVMVPVQR